MIDKNKARQLFNTYGGNHYLMEKDGVYGEYLEYTITKDQEDLWGNELIGLLINKFIDTKIMDENTHKLFDLLQTFKRVDEFIELVQLVFASTDKYDSFTVLLFLESCDDLLDYFKKNKTVSLGSLKRVNDILSHLSSSITLNNISINLYYKKQLYLSDYLSEKLIFERIQALQENNQWDQK